MSDPTENSSGPGPRIVRVDKGGANHRLLIREEKADFRRIEAAGVKVRVSFSSAEGKRYFLRLFSTLQLNAHFLSVIARTRLDHAEIVARESALRERIELVTVNLNKAIDGAEGLFQANGIAEAATYDTRPLEVEVSVLSSMGRRFLEALGKFDRLMPILQTLEIHEVISAQEVDIERAAMKRQLRDVSRFARSTATLLRRHMNALAVPADQPAASATELVTASVREEPPAEAACDDSAAAVNTVEVTP